MSHMRGFSENDLELERLLQVEEARHLLELKPYPELVDRLEALVKNIERLSSLTQEPEEKLIDMLTSWEQALALLRLWAPSELEFKQRLQRSFVMTSFKPMTEHYITDQQRLELITILRSHLDEFAQIARTYLETEQGTIKYASLSPYATRFLEQSVITKKTSQLSSRVQQDEDPTTYPDDDAPGGSLDKFGPYGLR